MPHRQNFLLNRLEPAVLAQILPHLSLVDLQHGHVLAETHQRVERVYFPHSGIISCVVELLGGGAIETGMIGNDGEFGATQALDHKVSLNHVVIQIAGVASVISSDRIREIANELPSFRGLLVKYEQFFLAQVQQTAACNAVHDVHTRTCKWLLRMHQLAGDDLRVTQEFLAQMMGVRRTSITEAAIALQKAGLISYVRGHVHIEDIGRVQSQPCECHEAVEAHFKKIFGPSLSATPPARTAA